MGYNVVVIPESFHKFGKHDIEHVCVPIVIGGGSYDTSMEVVNGIDRVLKAEFQVKSVEEPEGDDCTALYRRYTLKGEGGDLIVHVKLMGEDCGKIAGNRCSVLEFERDIYCIVKELGNC